MERFLEPIGADREFLASYLVPIYEELKRLNDNLEKLQQKQPTPRKKKEVQE